MLQIVTCTMYKGVMWSFICEMIKQFCTQRHRSSLISPTLSVKSFSNSLKSYLKSLCRLEKKFVTIVIL